MATDTDNDMSLKASFNRWAQKKPLATLSLMFGTGFLGASLALNMMPPLVEAPTDSSVYEVPCAQSFVTEEILQRDGENMTAIFSQKAVEDCMAERKQRAADYLHNTEAAFNDIGKAGGVLLAISALSLYNFRRKEKKNGIEPPKPK